MENLEAHIEHFCTLHKDKHLHVACSGGMDSTLLTYLVSRYHPKVTIIHVNYGLRGSESDGDEAFVRNIGEELDLEVVVRTVDLKKELESGGNLQEKARDFRHNWFREILISSANVLVLGHHRDDQVETFFLHLARRSGIAGLSGMHPERRGIHRPFLNIPRNDLEKAANSYGISWREDSSNASFTYRRNLIRLVVLPWLRNHISELDESVLVLSKAFRAEQLRLEQTISLLVSQAMENQFISTEQLENLNEFERVELLRQLEIPIRRLDAFRAFIESSKGKHFLIDHPDFSSLQKTHEGIEFILREETEFELQIETAPHVPHSYDLHTLYLDRSVVRGELKIRPWRVGDRIAPIGLNGTTLISAIIRDAGITGNAKRNVQVVHDDEGIIWCPGLKVSGRIRTLANSGELLRITVREAEVQQ